MTNTLAVSPTIDPIELIEEPTTEQWRQLYTYARSEAAIAPDQETRAIRLMICASIEVVLATLEAGEAPAPAPSFLPSAGEGCCGSGPHPWPQAPQRRLAESDFTSDKRTYAK